MSGKTDIPGVLYLQEATGDPAPVVFDSPHSGEVLPPEFDYIVPLPVLRTGVDMFVDELFSAGPAAGASLLAAHFPRMFIDANRSEDDIDPAMIDGTWTRGLNPTDKSAKGFGLIRTLALPDQPVHARPLTVAEIEDRIDRYFTPYHTALKRQLDQCFDRFGGVWHVDCHSMKSMGNRMNDDAGKPRADFVISDRDGTTSDPAFTAFVAGQLKSDGYDVGINWPYKGAALIRNYSDPAANRHSIQIEINRRLYMDEENYEKSAGFDRLKADLDKLVRDVVAYARDQLR
ncbi:MAG: N-formylglutamate amidohydrolase [Rhodospirillales bacterium]